MSNAPSSNAMAFAMEVAIAVIAVLLTLVMLPEALGDRPYDPRPSRVFTHISLFVG